MNRVKEIREKNNIKQVELAKILNVSQGTLSNWERGVHDPDNISLIKLSEYFKVSTDYLLDNNLDLKRTNALYDIPKKFTDSNDAKKFIEAQPVLMGFGGYNFNEMSNESIIDFANELLILLDFLKNKYSQTSNAGFNQ